MYSLRICPVYLSAFCCTECREKKITNGFPVTYLTFKYWFFLGEAAALACACA